MKISQDLEPVFGGEWTRVDLRHCLASSESGEDGDSGDPGGWFRRLGRKEMGDLFYLATVRPDGAIDAWSRDKPALLL